MNWMMLFFGMLIGLGAGALLLHRRETPRTSARRPTPPLGGGGELGEVSAALAHDARLEPDPGNVLVQMAGDDMALVFGKEEALDRVGLAESHLPAQITKLAVGADATVKAFIAGGEMSGRLFGSPRRALGRCGTWTRFLVAMGPFWGSSAIPTASSPTSHASKTSENCRQ